MPSARLESLKIDCLRFKEFIEEHAYIEDIKITWPKISTAEYKLSALGQSVFYVGATPELHIAIFNLKSRKSCWMVNLMPKEKTFFSTIKAEEKKVTPICHMMGNSMQDFSKKYYMKSTLNSGPKGLIACWVIDNLLYPTGRNIIKSFQIKCNMRGATNLT